MDRDKFKKEAKRTIDDIVSKIDAMEARKNQAKADTKAEYEKKLATLKAKREELQTKYNAMADAADDQWEEAKEAFSAASGSFKEGLSKLGSLFK
jgi:phage host-nuclease inhibitor protein Gam